MKALTVRLFASFLALSFLAPAVYAAGEVEFQNIIFRQQTPLPGKDLVVLFGVTVANNSDSAIKGKLNAHLNYCEAAKSPQLAFTMGSQSIPAKSSSRVEGYFVPKDEQSLRFSYKVNGKSVAEKIISRETYDSLGAELNPCKKMKKMMTPQTKVPLNKPKTVR
ncbi:MAG: hypothetical protein ABFR97_10695 [Thermodesulfobacteriota bacterium]